jgi:peptidoglycan/LPS O-acetylase OafA/YrhL
MGISDRAGAGVSGPNLAPFHLGYRPWLDGLRGVAVLMVLAFHLHLLPGGSFGVDVFFVLSGFLITSLLVEEWGRNGTISLRRFYLRRALRLLPAFAALLSACFLYTLLFCPDEEAAFCKEALVAACYVANWPMLHQTPMFLLGHTWSLSVEEQFYLLWPILLYALLRIRLNHRLILLAVFAGVIASGSLRCLLYCLHAPTAARKAATVARLYMGLDTRADALLVGCLIGLLAAWDRLPKSGPALTTLRAGALASAVGLAYVALYSCCDHSQFYYGLFTGVALAIGAVLVCLLAAPPVLAIWFLERPALVAVGRASYALYLFHMPIFQIVGRERLATVAGAATAIALSAAAAAASYFCIERPCLRLKHRLRSGNDALPAAAAKPRRAAA